MTISSSVIITIIIIASIITITILIFVIIILCYHPGDHAHHIARYAVSLRPRTLAQPSTPGREGRHTRTIVRPGLYLENLALLQVARARTRALAHTPAARTKQRGHAKIAVCRGRTTRTESPVRRYAKAPQTELDGNACTDGLAHENAIGDTRCHICKSNQMESSFEHSTNSKTSPTPWVSVMTTSPLHTFPPRRQADVATLTSSFNMSRGQGRVRGRTKYSMTKGLSSSSPQTIWFNMSEAKGGLDVPE